MDTARGTLTVRDEIDLIIINAAHDTRQARLDYINQRWTDMRPQSLIDAMNSQ